MHLNADLIRKAKTEDLHLHSDIIRKEKTEDLHLHADLNTGNTLD